MHADAATAERLLGRAWMDETDSFATIRNPWARMLSSWRFKVRKAEERLARGLPPKPHLTMSDEEFLEKMNRIGFNGWVLTDDHPNHTRSQLNWCRGADGAIVIKRVLRLENPDQDYLPGLSMRRLPVHNDAGATLDYRTYYSDDARARVEERFAEDIEYGGYSF